MHHAAPPGDVRSRNETWKCDPTLTRNLRAVETNAQHNIGSGEIFTHPANITIKKTTNKH